MVDRQGRDRRGAGQGRPEPVPLARVLGDLGGRRGWGARLEGARVHALWPEIAGPEIAAHARPVRLLGGVLVLAVADAAWATQLRYLAPQLLDRCNQVLGHGSADTLQIRTEP